MDPAKGIERKVSRRDLLKVSAAAGVGAGMTIFVPKLTPREDM